MRADRLLAHRAEPMEGVSEKWTWFSAKNFSAKNDAQSVEAEHRTQKWVHF
jgi:hypothetical protein